MAFIPYILGKKIQIFGYGHIHRIFMLLKDTILKKNVQDHDVTWLF